MKRYEIKKDFTLAETQKNISLATFRGRGIKGEGVNAFTLAETLIVLVILGVVAAITIPALVKRHVESANRTRVRKAMAVYDMALNKIVVENGIKSNGDLYGSNGFAPAYDCSKTVNYFKPIQKISDCRFKTADGVWWDITFIHNPMIALDEKYKDYIIEDWDLYSETLEDENGNPLYVFAMTGRFDDATGSLRVNDKEYEDRIGGIDFNNTQKYLAKLYSFINNTEDLDLKYSKPCPNQCDVMATLGGGSSGCSGCSFDFD